MSHCIILRVHDIQHDLSLLMLTLISWDFPGGSVVKNPPANAGDTGSIPGLGRSHMPRSNQARAPQLLSLRTTTTEARAP